MHQLRACMLSCFSHVQLCQALAPWTVAFEALLSVGFSRQKYWSGLSCPPAGDLPNPGIEPMSLMSPALAGRLFTTSTTWAAHALITRSINSQKQQLEQKAAQTLRRSMGGTQVGISLGRIRRDLVVAVTLFQD